MEKVYLVTVIESTEDGVFVHNEACGSKETALRVFEKLVSDVIADYEISDNSDFESSKSEDYFYTFNEMTNYSIEVKIEEIDFHA